MIVDAHQHLWSLARGDYFWLDAQAQPALAPIARDFELAEYLALAHAAGVEASVLVQAAPTVAETEWLLAQAAASDGFVRGVVGWIDMEAVDAVEQLDRLAANPRLVGIRAMLQDIADPHWVLQARFAPVFQRLIELGLGFDLLIKPPQLDSALILLKRHPHLRAVIDHGAKPQIAVRAWQPWADAIARIAAETGALCKISGLVTEARPDWRTADLAPYVGHLIASFGASRLMWGSDWPVALLASDYARWQATARELTRDLTAVEQAAVFGGNALRCYARGVSR